MNRNFKEALVHRRTYYSISNQSPITDPELEGIIRFVLNETPSAFNSQSSRIVLLLGDQHRQLWSLTKEALRKIVPPENFAATEKKIDGSFAAGYGTVLYFEDQSIIEGLQNRFPAYAHNFPTWSEHTSAMHQLIVWTMLEDAGLGASLQHYNPLIEEQVHSTWNLPKSWKLIAEMPFGTPTAPPDPKEHAPIESRFKVFK